MDPRSETQPQQLVDKFKTLVKKNEIKGFKTHFTIIKQGNLFVEPIPEPGGGSSARPMGATKQVDDTMDKVRVTYGDQMIY